MTFRFTFRTAENTKDLKGLVDFLIKQSLRYPNYEDWVQRAEHEIDSGYKRAILAFSEGYLVGNLIFQPHKELPRVRELKNLRIHNKVRRRDFAHFMLRQAEVENPGEYDTLICDVRQCQRAVINLLTLSGYTPIGSVSLYDPDELEVVMVKSLNERTASGIIYKARNLILSQ